MFSLQAKYRFRRSYSALPLQWESYVNELSGERAWLCSNKTLFTETGSSQDPACGLQFAYSYPQSHRFPNRSSSFAVRSKHNVSLLAKRAERQQLRTSSAPELSYYSASSTTSTGKSCFAAKQRGERSTCSVEQTFLGKPH